MPLVSRPVHIFEPTPLQCGQAVLAMLSGCSVEEIIKIVKTERETTLKDMKIALKELDICFDPERKEVARKDKLPPIAI